MTFWSPDEARLWALTVKRMTRVLARLRARLQIAGGSRMSLLAVLARHDKVQHTKVSCWIQQAPSTGSDLNNWWKWFIWFTQLVCQFRWPTLFYDISNLKYGFLSLDTHLDNIRVLSCDWSADSSSSGLLIHTRSAISWSFAASISGETQWEKPSCDPQHFLFCRANKPLYVTE